MHLARFAMNVVMEPWVQLLSQQAPPIAEAALAPGTAGGSSNSGPLPPAATAAADAPLFPDGCSQTVPRIPASELSYENFCLNFMEAGRPVVIVGATEGWQAVTDWVLPGGGVDLDFLQCHFGSAQVTVTDTGRAHEGCGPCREMALADFLAWWRQHSQQRQQQQRQNAHASSAQHEQQQQQQQVPAALAAGSRHGSQQQPLWYCKDWHLASEFPQYQAYGCPSFFQDDWLNEWYDAHRQKQGQRQHAAQQQQAQQQQQDGQHVQQQQAVSTSDYRFVYLGPKGTSTPLHSDVLRSFSWSANVAGRKLWRLLPPQHSHLLLDRHGHSTAWDFFQADPEGLYPGLPQAQQHLMTVEQQPGEAIFVPSGWFHTVENLEDCVSINHNWINGHNVHWCWALLRQERRQAEEAIEDCRQLCSPAEFEGLVQRNLGANAGMDYAGLGVLLRCIAERSLRQLAAAQLAGGSRAGAGLVAGGSSFANLTGQQQQEQQQQQQQQVAAAAAVTVSPNTAGLGSLPPLPPQQQTSGPKGSSSPLATGLQASLGYHAFRLQRVALVLQQLLAEQQEIDDRCRRAQLQQLHQQQGQLMPPPPQCSGGGTSSSSSIGREVQAAQLPHAEEAAANSACLGHIQQQLRAHGFWETQQ